MDSKLIAHRALGTFKRAWICFLFLLAVGTLTAAKPAAPLVSGVIPSSGTGLTATFHFRFTADSFKTAQILFGTFPGSDASSCSITYDLVNRKLWLLSDLGGTLRLGPVIPGTSIALQNSQCAINPATAVATLSGTVLDIGLNVTFAPTFGKQLVQKLDFILGPVINHGTTI